MADLWDYQQLWRRRWRQGRRQGEACLQAWRQWWRSRSKQLPEKQGIVGAMEVTMDMGTQQMEQRTLQSIREAVRAELLEDVKAEAFQAAIAELDDRLQQQREQLRDGAAKERQALTSELEDELERREDAIRRQTRDTFEERLEVLKDDLKAAAAARDQVTTLLVSLVTQLVAEKKRYLHDAGITELDLLTLNQVLAPQGLQIRSEFRHSERQVACTLKNGIGQRTVFWREAVKPGTITVDA
jgi:hypothetical protein